MTLFLFHKAKKNQVSLQNFLLLLKYLFKNSYLQNKMLCDLILVSVGWV